MQGDLQQHGDTGIFLQGHAERRTGIPVPVQKAGGADLNDKPYSESCEQNRAPILAVLREVFADRSHVLEIGSGTGQHAVFFGAELPHLRWQTADLPLHHPGIRLWLDEAALPNVLPPIALDVNRQSWHDGRYDAVFSANTLHIMSWIEVESFG